MSKLHARCENAEFEIARMISAQECEALEDAAFAADVAAANVARTRHFATGVRLSRECPECYGFGFHFDYCDKCF